MSNIAGPLHRTYETPLAGPVCISLILLGKLGSGKCAGDQSERVDSPRRYQDRPNRSDPLNVPELLQAASNGSGLEVKSLLEQGHDVNAKDSNGYAALIRAVKSGNGFIVNLLLEAGADINHKAFDGRTAEAWAREKRDVVISRLFEAHRK